MEISSVKESIKKTIVYPKVKKIKYETLGLITSHVKEREKEIFISKKKQFISKRVSIK